MTIPFTHPEKVFTGDPVRNPEKSFQPGHRGYSCKLCFLPRCTVLSPRNTVYRRRF